MLPLRTLTSMESFHHTKASLQWKKILQIIDMFFTLRKNGSLRTSSRNRKCFFYGITEKGSFIFQVYRVFIQDIVACIYACHSAHRQTLSDDFTHLSVKVTHVIFIHALPGNQTHDLLELQDHDLMDLQLLIIKPMKQSD